MISTGPEGHRVFFGYGTNRNGIVEIVDRDKLLHGPTDPTVANLLYRMIARLDLPPDVGGQTNLIRCWEWRCPNWRSSIGRRGRDTEMLDTTTVPRR